MTDLKIFWVVGYAPRYDGRVILDPQVKIHNRGVSGLCQTGDRQGLYKTALVLATSTTCVTRALANTETIFEVDVPWVNSNAHKYTLPTLIKLIESPEGNIEAILQHYTYQNFIDLFVSDWLVPEPKRQYKRARRIIVE